MFFSGTPPASLVPAVPSTRKAQGPPHSEAQTTSTRGHRGAHAAVHGRLTGPAGRWGLEALAERRGWRQDGAGRRAGAVGAGRERRQPPPNPPPGRPATLTPAPGGRSGSRPAAERGALAVRVIQLRDPSPVQAQCTVSVAPSSEPLRGGTKAQRYFLPSDLLARLTC